MTVSQRQGALKKFRRTPWKFQATFGTPLKDLERFVQAITSGHEPLEAASMMIDAVIFEPNRLLELLDKHALPRRYGRDVCIEAVGQHEVQELLQAVLADWIDFAFVPAPKPFVIYADHDEYTTLYANTKSKLNVVADRLMSQGFERIKEYERNLLER